jgi:hypothetical protein
MNILVCPHELAMGGSQINAIELAAAVRDKGHNVTIAAPDGVLVSMINELKIDYVPICNRSYFPSMSTAFELATLARRIKADIVHSYEWRPAIECSFGPHLFGGQRMLATVLSMDISHLFPLHVPLIVGTRELADMHPERRTWVLEPPIDADRNKSTNVVKVREKWGCGERELVISIVCRLTEDLDKLGGVLQAIDTIDDMAAELNIRLIVAGDGDGKPQVDAAAMAVNARHQRTVVSVTGQLLDPREVYELSDIVLGMGSSALKGMAFSKPLVVQGTNGFWRLFDEESIRLFLYQGFFGHGGDGVTALRSILDGLANDPGRREALGRFGRMAVEQHFSLDLMANRLIEIYKRTVEAEQPLGAKMRSAGRSVVDLAKFRVVMGLRGVGRRTSGGAG